MPTPHAQLEQPDDAAFWEALAIELQSAVAAPEPTLREPLPDVSDHVFHDDPVDLDAPPEPEPLPTWGEVFTW